MQGRELVDLLHRACFYGREKGFAQERIKLGYLPSSVISDNAENGVNGRRRTDRSYEENVRVMLDAWNKRLES